MIDFFRLGCVPQVRGSAFLCGFALACVATLAHADARRAMEFAWNILDDPVHAQADAERLVKQARADGDADLLLDALAYLREARLENFDNTVSKAEAQEIVDLARKLGRLPEYCVQLRGVGREAEREQLARESTVCRAASELDDIELATFPKRKAEVLAHLEKGYPLWEARHDLPRMLIGLYFATVTFSGTIGLRHDEASLATAEAMGKRMLAVAEQHPPRYYTGLQRRRLAIVLHERGDDAAAEALLRETIDQFNRLGYPSAARLTRFRLAILKFDAGAYREALQLFQQSRPTKGEGENNWDLRIGIHLYLARTLAHLGRRQEALDELAAAKATVGKDQPIESVYFEEGAADVYASLGDYPQAYQAMKAWREAGERQQDAAREAEAHELSTRFQVELKDKDNALLRSQAAEAEAVRRQAVTQQWAIAISLGLGVLLLAAAALLLRRRAAAARMQAAHDRQLAHAAESANAAKSEFLANMSHELRSPLNAILGFTRIAAREPEVPAGIRADLDVVVRSGEHLYDLINQVLDLSKIEAGRMTLNETACDLADLVDEIDELFGLASSQKGLALTIDTGAAALPTLQLDAGKLRQVLINLIGNAIKFTDTGGVTVRLRIVGGNDEPLRLSVAVIDTGPGVAPEELARLGQAFVQAEAGRNSREGTGLGLALCRAFVEIMGGELALSSAPGHGLTATFDIPVTAATGEAISVDRTARRVLGLKPGQPRYRILAVDDREEGRQLLMRLLTPLGFEVREAANGQQAVEQWRAWRPHLIFMDMRMPVMDGREATRIIRSEPDGAATVIVALTASSFESERQGILDAGCDDFLRKPFREPDLFRMIERHIGAVFDVDDAVRDAPAEVDPDALAALPQAVRLQLREALQRLDIDAIQAAIAEVRACDAMLAHRLEALANDYQYSRLHQMLSAH